jgi:FAD/FMN-containing dehydrogenase
MFAAGYLDYDEAQQRYALPAEHVPALATEPGPALFGGVHQELMGVIQRYDQVAAAFRHGGGVRAADLHSEHHQHHRFSRRPARRVLRRSAAARQPGYEEARRVFNGTTDRQPALIARCTSTADVAAAVHAAREHGLVVAVRCGGHSFSGLSTCDDGMLIDLGGLKSIGVDPRAGTARAGGGVLWGEFDAATRAYGLHTPGGRVTTTGLGGFTTGAAYLNFTPEADRVRDAYGEDKYARLVSLKDTYDPANLFRLNQNIRPGQAAAEPVLA